MELESAGRRHLMSDPAVRGYVQTRVFAFRLHEHVDQQGTRAIVLRRVGGWGNTPSSTQEFPLLRLMCWADSTRSDEDQARDDAISNAYAVHRVADAALLQQRRNVWWGGYGVHRGLRVITIQRWSEPSHRTRDDGSTYEGMPLGDSAVVVNDYALQVVH